MWRVAENRKSAKAQAQEAHTGSRASGRTYTYRVTSSLSMAIGNCRKLSLSNVYSEKKTITNMNQSFVEHI